jgi:molybdopterin molybdotransferase
VRAAETPGRLAVVFRVAAGVPSGDPLPAASAAGIATGGAVPEGADSVVPIEHATVADGVVEVGAVEPGANVRPRGGDVRAGDVAVRAGTRLGAVQIGALTAAGVAAVSCTARPRAAVLATGSELRSPGEQLGPGQIFESNRALLAAALGPLAEVDVLPVVADDPVEQREALERGLGADVLVTTGGVSVGPHDLVRGILGELGVREVFWGVAVKPGKPLSFGVRGETLVFGLPGNPVSALVEAFLFVRPALLARQGASDPGPAYSTGALAAPLRRNAARDELVRARRSPAGETVSLSPVTGQESHMIVRAASADALVHVPRGEGELPAGAAVRYLELT